MEYWGNVSDRVPGNSSFIDCHVLQADHDALLSGIAEFLRGHDGHLVNERRCLMNEPTTSLKYFHSRHMLDRTQVGVP